MSIDQAHALFTQGDMEGAAQLCRDILAREPAHAQALLLLGAIAGAGGDMEGAATHFRAAAEAAPGNAAAHYNLGVCLVFLGRTDEAVDALSDATRQDTHHDAAFAQLGVLLLEKQRFAEALPVYERLAALRPTEADARSTLGFVHANLGQVEAAEEAYGRALALNPAHGPTHLNRSKLALKRGLFADAAAYARAALDASTDKLDAWVHLGAALVNLRDLKGAVAAFDKAYALAPHRHDLLHRHIFLRRYICDWDGLAALTNKVLDDTRQGASFPPPFNTLFLCDDLEVQRRAAEAFWIPLPHVAAAHAIVPLHGRRLRIGYLSADFQNHATGVLMAGLLEAHDRTQFEIFAFSYGRDDGTPLRQRFIRGVDHFIDVADLESAAVAQNIRGHEIDILVDLKGHTEKARMDILCYRPAPIQVHYLGYPGPLGSDLIDYAIVDEIVAPPGDQSHYGEKLVHLPRCYQVNDRSRVAGRIPTRAACGLPESGIVFCCFNNAYKITPEVFEIWMQLLKDVPGSVLWLLLEFDIVTANLRAAAAKRGIDPARLVFAPRAPLTDHLARHALADLFLDTWPYNAHTTASDAIWMGVPIVTYAGNAFAARVAASILHEVGVPELVTTSPAAYHALAQRLALEPETLRAVRAKLTSARESRLFDTVGFCRDLEAAFITMWERYERGEPVAPFKVARPG
jgi:predicted O-linked N-acetylglucosamine transferase (SPINDLY family)